MEVASFPSAAEGGQSVGTPAWKRAYSLEIFDVTGVYNRWSRCLAVVFKTLQRLRVVARVAHVGGGETCCVNKRTIIRTPGAVDGPAEGLGPENLSFGRQQQNRLVLTRKPDLLRFFVGAAAT